MNRIPLGEAAARYADAGWPIFPLHEIRDGACSCTAGPTCAHPGRHPRTRNGHHDATTDRDTVTRWWHRWPTANLATPNGAPSGLAVIDLDGPEGAATWTTLKNEYGHLATATAQTPHGRHLWYRIPEGLTVPRRIRGLGPGIDLLGTGGYTLLPVMRRAFWRCGWGFWSWSVSSRRVIDGFAVVRGDVEDVAVG